MERLLSMGQVQEKVSFSRSHLNDLVREKLFPAPIRINTSIRWPESLVEEWIQNQIKIGSGQVDL